MQDLFDRYLKGLRQIPLDQKTEHSDRGRLEELLIGIAKQAAPGATVQHEPKQVAGKGAPDFKVTKAGLIIGYVENKTVGENLDKILKSAQIKKYKSLSENILLTDYLHWVWIKGDPIQRETLCFATDLENPKYKVRAEKAAAVGALIEGFLSSAPEGIGRAQTLALALATRSQLLHDFLGEELVRQERVHKEGRLFGLYEVFRDQVFHDLTLADFADAFAQMLAYGLFLARLNSDKNVITLHNAREYVPGSFRLIRELVQFLDELTTVEYRDIRWVVEEVLSIVNGLDLPAIHEDLSFSHQKMRRGVKARDEEEARLFGRDPFVYFYEDYLGKYDAKMKKARGVYYTPPPIVNFIVRGIDDILKETFGIKQGLADHKRVTVLDFACGTGTFLLEVLERIFDTIGKDSGKRDLIVREHILKNIYGFEYLIAPYTIAHLKLSQYLEEQGHKLQEDERLQIFLTNTLEPIEPQKNYLLPALSAETEAAQKVKEKPILVITGNPPYLAASRNKGEWIRSAIESYKFVDGKPFGEKKHWLQDDYVKFIRFAQMKMDAIEEGIVAIITNHSYLDNPTFRGMRQSLMQTFDQIWVLDLHGNTKKKEKAPDGGGDRNVFDIEQGVAVAFFIKKPGSEKGIWHSDLWGARQHKYQALAETKKGDVYWKEIQPSAPFYFFFDHDETSKGEYEQGWVIGNIFIENVTGIVTARDHFAVAYARGELEKRIEKFIDSSKSDDVVRAEFGLKDTRGWRMSSARQTLAGQEWRQDIRPILYRPFDVREIVYRRDVVDWGRWDSMSAMLRDNIGLSVIRKMDIQGGWEHVLACDGLMTHHTVSMKEVNYIFPLYLYAPEQGKNAPISDLFDHDPFVGKERIENIDPKFRNWLNDRYDYHFEPEEIFGYIYAVLHAPIYRQKYAEFLRIDFPRIPFAEKRADFEALSGLGWELAQTHLMRDVPERGLGLYKGKGDHEVVKPRYVAAEQAVYINKTQFFAPIPEEVWDFHIGGYQVIDKYLKSRKGRKLGLDEIDQVGRIANILAFTIDQMEKIDGAYSVAFVDKN